MRWHRIAAFSLFCLLGLQRPVMPPVSAQEPCRDPRRIVGGEDTDIKNHPWQVALKANDGGFCGGVIIAQNWILTAAHCFASSKRPDSLRVKSGATNHKLGGAWGAVDQIVIHEQYNSKTHEHDLALVKLKVKPAGQSIPLANPTQELKQCEMLEITGWGRTKEEGGGASDKLQKALVPYVDNETCNQPGSYKGAIRPGMMCAGLREGGVDTCQGDSGGPLVLNSKTDGAVLVGVVSWGEGCARKLKYGVYTRVSAYRDWITKVITIDGK